MRDAKRNRFLLATAIALYPLVLSAPGFAQTPGPAPNLVGRLGQSTFVSANFVLSLDVRVQTPEGAPFKSTAVVTLYARSGLPILTTTTKSSGALFTQLAPGSYYVEVEAPGYWKTRQDAVVDPAVGDNIVKVPMTPDTGGSRPIVYYHTPLLAPDVQKELNKAIESIQADKLDAAEKRLKYVQKKAPDHPAVLYVLGIAAQKMGNQEAARSFWEKSMSFDPTQEITVYALGQSYLSSADYAKADEVGRQLLQLNPNSWKAEVLVASAAFRQGRYTDAVSHAERAIEIGGPVAGGISIVLAQALAVQGRKDEGIEALKRYLGAKPGNPQAATAQSILEQLQTNSDRFVIAGAESSAVDLTSVPAPVTSPLVEHWVPADIDAAVPPVEPGASCNLDEVLANAGKQLQVLPRTLDRFSAKETLQQQTVNEDGVASRARTLAYDYVVSIHQTRPGYLDVEEYRDGTQNESVFPDHFATLGLPSEVFLFHPFYQHDFDFRCEGLARQGTGFAWQLRFEQKKSIPSRMQVHYLNGRRYPVPLKGRAWIDAEDFEVVRLITDLREPLEVAGLIAQHTDIRYGPVHFRKDNIDLWLPIEADYYVQTKAHRIHRRHDFSNYVLFSVESKESISKPKGASEPPQ